jgi:toxin YoeB
VDNITFSTTAWEEYQYWAKTDKKKLERINRLLKDTLRHPFEGIGNPEPLKLNLQGYWSRRIDEEHRLIYKYNGGNLAIVSCKDHY